MNRPIAKLLGLALLALCACTPGAKNSRPMGWLNVLDYGVKGDSSLCTIAFQKALDAAGKEGGTVYVPGGKYLIGTIFLRSNTTLHLAPGAVLLGSGQPQDYIALQQGHNDDRTPYHLIVIQDAENVAIEGTGTIDGQGWNWWEGGKPKDEKPRWMRKAENRPSPMVEIVNSKRVRVRDITLTNPPGWTLHGFNTDDLLVDGVTIDNHLYSPNSDGIDLTGCYHVRVANCNIRTCDDAVCIKTTPDSRESADIVVTNCNMQTTCVALKFGTETWKDIRDVTFSNCVIRGSSRGFGLYANRGGAIENVLVENIVCNTNAPLVLNRPIQIGAYHRLRKADGQMENRCGSIRNVTVSNYISTTEGRILIYANEGCTVDNIKLRDVHLSYPYIEDPQLYAAEATSEQFRGIDSLAMAARAAVVATNVSNLRVEGLTVTWPQADTVPSEWKHPMRIENGKFDKEHFPDYSRSIPVPFQAFYGSGLVGGYLNSPGLTSTQAGLPPVSLQRSTMRVLAQ